MSTRGGCADDAGTTPESEPLDPVDDTDVPWPHRPCETDPDKPSVARVYDVYQGGSASTRADRAFAEQAMAIIPDARKLAVVNRRVQARAVRFVLDEGVNQIIDIGAGIPSLWSTHLLAHGADPNCRVVYVDHERVAYEAIRAAVAGDARLAAVHADLRDVADVLHDPATTRLIDLDQPVVLLLGLVLHFVPDEDDPAGLLASYRQMIAPGSLVVISHGTADGREADMTRLAKLYAEMGRPLALRDHAELRALLNGFDVIEPGIVHTPLWRPDPDDPVVDPPERSCAYIAVART